MQVELLKTKITVKAWTVYNTSLFSTLSLLLGMSREILFELRQLGLSVGNIQILRSVDLKVYQGEFLVILGASGAGKSSLLRMFNALSSPSSGTISFRSHPVGQDISTLRDQVGFLFQNPVAFEGTVKQNLMIAGRWKHPISQLLDHELLDALDQVGLKDISLEQEARDLSGGEQQRLALATTLLNKPSVLLLDEPTSSLDPKLSTSVLKLVEDLRERLDLTVIAVSHDHVLMRKFASRAILLAKGEIAGEGSFSELEKRDAFRTVGLLDEEVGRET